MTQQQAAALENVVGAKIVAAFSSLTSFSCELDNQTGLLIEAIDKSGSPAVSVKLVPAAELPREMDAVCRVDWTWIFGTAVKSLATTAGAARFDLSDVGPLTIAAQTWQNKPFLSFQPFRPAK